MKWIVCQIGARENYSVARALQRRGVLGALVTDLWARPGSWLRFLPHASSLAGRYEEELSRSRVFAPNARMILFALRTRLFRWPVWKKILAENRLFQRQAAKFLFGGSFEGQSYTLFAYSYAARELFREAKRRGWVTVLGQIDPGEGERRIVEDLRRANPLWAGDPAASPPPSYWEEWREECDLADRIVVNSEWSKSLLIKEGIAAEKIEVVPLAYEPAGGRSDQRTKGQPEVGDRRSETANRLHGNQLIKDEGTKEEEVRSERLRVAASGKVRKWECGNVEREYPEKFTTERPLRVLFLGQAIVRKGIQDLAEAARLLGDGPWHFEVVGRHPALPEGIPPSMTFHGQVPRNQAGDWFGRADVFVLPTHSDGFALTQLEAMAYGLPVIATPCCGEVVRDGVNGMIVPAGDAEVLAGAVRSLAREPQRLAAMSRAAFETAHEFGIDRVGDELLGSVRTSAQ